MTNQARAPDRKRPLAPRTRLNRAIVGLAEAITELIYLSADDHAIMTRKLTILRTRRQQLSAVIDRLTLTAKPPPLQTRKRR